LLTSERRLLTSERRLLTSKRRLLTSKRHYWIRNAIFWPVKPHRDDARSAHFGFPSGASFNNPEGIESYSPGLSRQRLPWVLREQNRQPQRGCIIQPSVGGASRMGEQSPTLGGVA
jgi:hypothetical protein